MKVTSVIYKTNYSIQVLFEDGIEGIVDLAELVEKGIFSVLKDKALFSKAYTTGYSIAWSDELEIDAANIYAEITGKNPLASFISTPAYATD
ncbi:MAG: DUF2442 domain-containing protein [Thermosphaera sp.]